MKRAILYTFLFQLFFISCTKENENNESIDNRLSVVCTTGIIADLVSSIGGDRIQCSSLMGPGVDPHLYKASHGDLQTLQSADIIFYNGLHLEGKMTEVLQKLSKRKVVKALSDGLVFDQFLQDPFNKGNPDPHIWFDIELWGQTIPFIRDALIKNDPTNASYYKTRAEEYSKKLLDLHEQIKKQIRTIPEAQRVLITAHDAFNYFERAYGIKVLGLQGISTLSEFGLYDRIDMVAFIIENQIPSIFVESSVSDKNIRALLESCRAKGHEVNIGGTLYSDALGDAESGANTYISMIEHNVSVIIESLL